MTKIEYRWNELATNAGGSIGSDSTMFYVYDCETPFAVTTAGLTEDQEEALVSEAFTAAGNRYSSYKCHRDEIPAGVEIYEGQALKDYFNL